MTIGRTNSGSGGGGISSNSALLVVYAPLGSIVTATKDGVTKTSKKDIALSDRPMVGVHFISIGSSQFGTWTVTATRETDTNTTTISVSAVERYELYIGYHVPLQIYQEVEYIQTGTAPWLDLNMQMPQNSKIEILSMFTVKKASNTLVAFGLSSDSINKRGILNVRDNGAYATWLNNSVVEVTPQLSANTYQALAIVTFSSSGQTTNITVNGSTYTNSQSYTPGTMDRLYLCNASNGGQPGAHKLYYCKVWSNNSLVRELYPCYRLSDSVAGMYDKANDVFYTNAGSGTFIVGADV